MKETRKISTRKRFELETLGSRLIVPKIFPQTLMQNNQLLTKIQIELKDNSNTVEMRQVYVTMLPKSTLRSLRNPPPLIYGGEWQPILSEMEIEHEHQLRGMKMKKWIGIIR
jgi:hypothetical protein